MHDSPLTEKEQEELWRAQEAAEDEAEWFFGTLGGRVPEEGEATPETRTAALAIRGWLDRLATFHVGALALRFTPRKWPPALEQEFRGSTSLVVRLDCAAHAARGSTEELEQAAARRLEEGILSGKGKGVRRRLIRHAADHVHAAVRSYVSVRGVGPCVVPVSVPEPTPERAVLSPCAPAQTPESNESSQRGELP